MAEQKLEDNPNVFASKEIKLKDRAGRASYIVDLHSFPFKADLLVVSKVRGRNNCFQFFAVKNPDKNKDGKSSIRETKKPDAVVPAGDGSNGGGEKGKKD